MFLDKNKTIFDRQFGFRKNHSTNDTLFCLTEAMREKLDKGEFSCGVFLDNKRLRQCRSQHLIDKTRALRFQRYNKQVGYVISF